MPTSKSDKPMFNNCISGCRSPGYRTGLSEYKRLVAFLVASLVIHLLALALVGTPAKPTAYSAPDLVLQWAPLPPEQRAPKTNVTLNESSPNKNWSKNIRTVQRAPKTDDALNKGSSNKNRSEIIRSNRSSPPESPQTVTNGTTTGTAVVTNDHGQAFTPTVADLLESSRDIVRNIAHEQEKDQRQNGARKAPSFFPELDRALRKASPGEIHFADGLLKITTESGRVYCLKPPPEFARGGPVEALSVPTNCP